MTTGRETIEILPGKLSWAFGSATSCSRRCHSDGVEVLRLTDLCDSTHRVLHYSTEALGRTRGPLSLWQTLGFCQALHSKLDSCKSVVFVTPLNDIAERSNAAVLLGAYLVFYLKWTTSHIGDVIGTLDANRAFVHSWARVNQPKPKCVLTVKDCWDGLYWAHRHGWINPFCFTDDKSLSATCTDCQQMVAQYDAAWIVPGRLLVCADPMSTLLDPAPSTFSELFPSSSNGCKKEDLQREINSESTGSTACDDVEAWETDSCDTLCKEYDDIDGRAGGTMFRVDSAPVDFATFLKKCGVEVIVRANHLSEPGLAKSYDPSDFVAHGFHFEDMQIADTNGGLPSHTDVSRLLSIYDNLLDIQGKAIAIHCKGGFGRSVTLACCLAIARFGIPARAALAWVRIARPGSITCSQQEDFITSFRSKQGPPQPQCCCTQ